MATTKSATTVYPQNHIFYIGENLFDFTGDRVTGNFERQYDGVKGIFVPTKHKLFMKFKSDCFEGEFGAQYGVDGGHFFPADEETFRATKSAGKFRLEERLAQVPITMIDEDSSIVFQCTDLQKGGGAFNAAKTASEILKGSNIPLGVTLFANVHNQEVKEEIEKQRGTADLVRYKAMCECGENEIGRNLTYNHEEEGEDTKKYTFTSPSRVSCGRCNPQYLFSLGDTVQINSIKDAGLFRTIADCLRANKVRFSLKVVACITDSMLKAMEEQDSRMSVYAFIEQLADVLIVNETELASLLQVAPDEVDIESPEPLFRKIDSKLRFGGKTFLTLGKKGIALLKNRNVLYQQTAEDVKRQRGETSGCGDRASAVITLFVAEDRMWDSRVLEAANAAGQIHYLGKEVTIPAIKAFVSEHRRLTPVRILNQSLKRFEKF